MKLILTDHLKNHLKQRKISKTIIKEIFNNAKEFYWDNLRSHHIVIGKALYKRKVRKMLAAYDKIGDESEVITAHPIEDTEIMQRLASGRWIHEENKD